MREQVITPRASGRNALAGNGRSSGVVQRPARRDRGAHARARSGGPSKALVHAALVGKITLGVAIGVLIFAGYRAAVSAQFFQMRKLDVSGASHASGDEIRAVVRRAVAKGVWRADPATISAQLEQIPWVRTAVVSRVLPDGLRVRITERVPRAVVRTAAGSLIWVDEDAVNLGPFSPADHVPAFFISGWDEAGTREARAENRERVQRYLAMARDWGAAGLSERVSEVNLGDLRDVRAQLAGGDSGIEVRLGGDDTGNGLKRALSVLDDQRQTPCGPFITYLVVLPKKIDVGVPPGKLPCHSVANWGAADAAAGEMEARRGNGLRRKRSSRAENHAAGGGARMRGRARRTG